MTTQQTEILDEIIRERERQNSVFGLQKYNPVEWTSLLVEEVSEVAKAANEHHFEYYYKGLRYGEIELKKDQKLREFKKELIQVAAICVQILESFESL